MSVTIEITISENLSAETPETGEDDIPASELLQAWASAAYLNKTDAVASMMVTTSEEIQQLNKQYRHKDMPTNVLSFPMQLPEELDIHFLGDIALCASVIKTEAEQQSKTEQSHWAHMVVHGMLHLQGYDHIEDAQAEEMEQLEINILNKLGFENPYQ